MKKTKRILVIMMLIILMITKCSAVTVIEGTNITIKESIEVPYHYENEEKGKCDIMVYRGDQIYALGRYDNSVNDTVTSAVKCNDAEIRNILDYAYPIQMESTLGCLNEKEAYIATQEAIYCKLENKNVNKYVAENESGQRIINAIKDILKKANSQDERIIVKELSDWNDLSSTEKYKDYKMQCTDYLDGTVKTEQENVKITDLSGNIKKKISNGESFRVVVPKNTEMLINIKLEVDVIGSYIQSFSSIKDENVQYVMPEIKEVRETREYTEHVKTVKVNILNQDENYNIIEGSCFDILDSEYNKVIENLQTDAFGKISLNLDKGKYYLKQASVAGNYEINKGLLEIDIQDGNNASITVTNTKPQNEEITTLEKEINIKEETKQITEKNIKEITNINTTNINKEVINERNITNLNNVNNFINTINRKNVVNLEKENTYRNIIEEISKQDKILDGENITSKMTRSDYINHIDMLMHNNIRVPILPVASR